MTNMATMPIFGKNLKKIFNFKANWPMALKHGMGYIGHLSTTKNVQMMTLGWPWPILRQS